MTINARFSSRITALALLGGASLLLSACQTTGTTAQSATPAQQSETAGPAMASLSSLEQQYKKNPNDVNVAVRYARALRENDRLTRASIIISPFAKNDRRPHAGARAEYASIQASLGNYSEAREYATKAIALDKNAYQAYHIQGIALDAAGDHKGAEAAFRKALELWQGNPSPVLNNLGLNLASQGFLDEAAETLRSALETSPDRGEIERNLRIVEALRESGGRAPSYMQAERDRQRAEAEKKTTPAAAPGMKPILETSPVNN